MMDEHKSAAKPGCSCLQYRSGMVVVFALLLSLLEYHCVLWHQLDLPVYIYENEYTVKELLRRMTLTDNPLFQWIALAALYALNDYFLGGCWRLLAKNDWILAGLFSCVLVVGYSYDQLNSPVLLNRNVLLLAATGACLLGYFLLTSAVLSVFRSFFRHGSLGENRLPNIWEKHPFLLPMMVLFLAWLPYALVRYPAGMEFDAFEQIQQVLTGKLRANNPLVSTLFFGYGFVFGRNLFHSVNAGLFFVVICQMVLCAAMDAYAMLVMHRKKVSSRLQMAVLLMYALSPFVARYTTSIVKDAMYSHAVLFLVAALTDIVGCDRVQKKKKFPVLTFAALAVCFLRNNGIIVVGAAAAVYGIRWILHRCEKSKLLVLCSLIVPLCVYALFSNVIIPGLGIHKWGTSEILSLPFQQTARYVVNREDQITEEEKKIIDAVLDYERIKANYDPRLSDPVKMTYRGDEEALKVYFKYWAGEFVEHPVEYLSATFNNCYGFFYPEAREDEDARGTYRDSRYNETLLEVEYNEFQEMLTQHFGTVIRYLESLPVFYPLCNVGLQVWLFLWMFTSKPGPKAKYSRTAMVPVFASVLALIGMPTFSWNGFRYALPVVFAVPFLLGLFADGQMAGDDEVL